MHSVNVDALDLNLLIALRALLAERHVTRAAARVGLSQPAMSHALGRLRELLSDPILVRTPRGMQPTPRAESMREPLERVLAELARVLAAPARFDPAQSKHRFVIATSDYAELVLLPRLLARLWSEGPMIDVAVVPLTGSGSPDLVDGRADVAIGVPPDHRGDVIPRGIFQQKLFDDRFVCVARAGHPAIRKRLSLDAFCALSHALVSPRGRSGSLVDSALAKLGRKRRVAVELPHFLVAPHVVRETDVVVTLARRVAEPLVPALGLRSFDVPLELTGFSMSLFWHEQRHADPGHAWFRALIARVSRELR